MKNFLIATLLWTLALPAGAELQQADNVRLAELMRQGIAVIDIRTAGEWRETGVLEASHLLTFFDEQGRYDVNKWLADLADLAGPDKPVAIICLSGSRSMVVSNFLDKKVGYARVINVTRGIGDWLKEGRAVNPYP